MPPVQLTQLGPDASVDEVVETVSIDGAVIVEGVLSPENLALLDTELTPWIMQTNDGRDDFSGRSTTRTGALVARSPACRNIVMHKLGLAVAEQFLAAYTNRIQLHLTQVIRLKGGQGSQPLHRDRLAWGGYVPRQIEPQLNTLWALTEFTAENGATRVVPGSPAWPDDRRADAAEITQAEMTARVCPILLRFRDTRRRRESFQGRSRGAQHHLLPRLAPHRGEPVPVVSASHRQRSGSGASRAARLHHGKLCTGLLHRTRGNARSRRHPSA